MTLGLQVARVFILFVSIIGIRDVISNKLFYDQGQFILLLWTSLFSYKMKRLDLIISIDLFHLSI